MTRSFSGNGIAIKLATQPVLGLESADWPVLEIGTAALIILRSGDEAKLALALGDSAPVTLPFTIKLAADGRCLDPIQVTLTSQGSTITVGVFNQTLLFVADPPANPSQEVVVSAGTNEDWPLETMTVTVVTPDEIPAGDEGRSNSSTVGGSPDSKASKPGPTGSGANILLITGNDASVSKSNKVGTSSGGSTLEIFTPPAVRHGRTDAVRAALAPGKKS